MKDAYTFPVDIVARIKQLCDQVPGTPVRLLHNDIDHCIAEQDRAEQDAQALAARNAAVEQAKRDLKAERDARPAAANDG